MLNEVNVSASEIFLIKTKIKKYSNISKNIYTNLYIIIIFEIRNIDWNYVVDIIYGRRIICYYRTRYVTQ